MKNILLEILNNDTSYNKSATRYLFKTHPELWKQVLDKTSFLPNTALAKQRVWHIINNVFERPKCPITDDYLPWREKKYAKFVDLESKYKGIGKILSEVTSGDNHWRNKDPEKAIKANKKYLDGLSTGRIVVDYTKRDSAEILVKTKKTWVEKYGVDNPSKTKEVREKIYQASVKRGCTPREQRSLRRLYYDAVWRFTEESWKTQFDKINPDRLNRSENALDHIYSIQQGFRDNIPSYIIGHWTNLRIIPLVENSIKGMRCDKTQDELFDDFFQNIGKY